MWCMHVLVEPTTIWYIPIHTLDLATCFREMVFMLRSKTNDNVNKEKKKYDTIN